jgi:hypothetical protein
MAHETYKGHLILSRPDHTADSFWHPYIRVTWEDQTGVHSHEFLDTGIVFDTKEAAIAYGFAVGRLWVDEEL